MRREVSHRNFCSTGEKAGHVTRCRAKGVALVCMLLTVTSVSKIPHAAARDVWSLLPPEEDRIYPLRFGTALCMSRDGSTFVVGANAYNSYQGAVYTYDRVRGDGTRAHHWRRSLTIGSDTNRAEERQKGALKLTERGSGFGFSCALDSESNVLVVGAPGHSLQRGKLYLFSRDGNEWKEVSSLTLPGARSGDAFGWAVAMSRDGSTLAVSARGRHGHNGEVFLYDKTESLMASYELVSRMSPPDYTDEPGPNGVRIRNNFGVSLALSADGTVAAVGSTGFRQESGAVYILCRETVVGAWGHAQRLTAPDPKPFSFFGFKIAMDDRSNTVVVGADGEDRYQGRVYVFTRALMEGSPLIFLFKKDQCRSDEPLPNFSFEERIGENESQENDNFGGSVDISGDGQFLLVGAPGAIRKGFKDAGAFHLYVRVRRAKDTSDFPWKLIQSGELSDEHLKAGHFFAWSSAISYGGDTFLLSSPSAYASSGIVEVNSMSTKTLNVPSCGSLSVQNLSRCA